MTRDRINAKGEGMMFADRDEVTRAYQTGAVTASKLKYVSKKRLSTSMGV